MCKAPILAPSSASDQNRKESLLFSNGYSLDCYHCCYSSVGLVVIEHEFLHQAYTEHYGIFHSSLKIYSSFY